VTKEQELQHLRTFLQTLPKDSYLAGILEGIEEYAESQIDQAGAGLTPLTHREPRG